MKIDVSQFKEQGFLLLKNAIDPLAIHRIYDEVKDVFAKQIQKHLGISVNIHDKESFEQAMFRFFETDFNAFVHTGKTAQHTLALYQLSVSEAMLDIVKELGLENPSMAVRPSVQFNSRMLSKDGSSHWKLGAHQDWRTGQGSLDSLVVWFPLVPANEALGALEVIPGSHKNGLYDANTTGYTGFITDEIAESAYLPTQYEVGDILLFNAFLVHRSGNNTTQNIRWSVQYRYNNLNEPTFIERGYPMPYIYQPQHELLTSGFPSKEKLEEFFK